MAKSPIQFLFDFDGTLTKKDTLHLVSEVGYQKQQAARNATILPPWQDIVDAYMADYEAHTADYHPRRSQRKDILSEARWLDSLQDVETASANRVIEAGIFNDVTTQDMDSAATSALKANNVELRPGWAELLSRIESVNAQTIPEAMRPNMLQVVSVNWSRWFVWSVICNSTLLLKDQMPRSHVQNALKTISIYANEIDSINRESDTKSASTASPHGQSTTLRTAGDKLKHLQSQTSDPTTHPLPFRVYLGDSATDLECLVMADVGICVRDHHMGSSQNELAATAERLGIRVKRLDEYQDTCNPAMTLEELGKVIEREGKVLYFVHDFHEVEQWLIRVVGDVS